MYYGKLRYSANGSVVYLKDEIYETNDSCITSMRLWSGDECVFIDFCVAIESMDDYVELEKKVEKICNKLRIKITFEFDLPIEVFKYIEGSVDFGDDVVVMVPCLELGVSPLPPVILCDEEVGVLKETMEDDGRIFKYQQMYAAALGKKGLGERHMYLYSILLDLTGDKRQSCVEKLILKLEPRVDTYVVEKEGKAKGSRETLYTKLRNEIGHPRQGAFVRTTGKEIEQCIERFQALVKKAIKDFG
ncbi:hypothetical protein DFW101_2295 [Solidesulfovibrio carbinoliphilus subsp. oakridgensis]|uniref:Uncharacterized protein n=1 Tax=Solidesulfovibrio carbinoliphilus subsp. oakridgensis TaxID=694327 RepID=G7QAV9_9BACT|nr:hypothetical protein [Solidesulfovibrio carbinoliphilus]EHJ48300.1 hypothetical protein DFW101_2295 [Solidesulfovibrio carbinoliphilus subsp. oakridgensis]